MQPSKGDAIKNVLTRFPVRNEISVFTIELQDVAFYAHHGVFEQEKAIGNEFRVNLAVSYPAPPDEEVMKDNLGNTVSYAELYEIVKKEMTTPRNLLETVAMSIVNAIRSRHPEIIEINCRIEKTSPPIPSFQGKAAVAYSYKK